THLCRPGARVAIAAVAGDGGRATGRCVDSPFPVPRSSSPRTRQVTPTRPCGCGLGGAEYLSLNSLEREPAVLALFLFFPSFEDALCPAAIFCSSPAPRTCPSGCCAPWTAPWRTTARRPSPSSR